MVIGQCVVVWCVVSLSCGLSGPATWQTLKQKLTTWQIFKLLNLTWQTIKGSHAFPFLLAVIEICHCTVWKTIEEMALRIRQPFRGLFNFSLSFTFILNSQSFNPPEYLLVFNIRYWLVLVPFFNWDCLPRRASDWKMYFLVLVTKFYH